VTATGDRRARCRGRRRNARHRTTALHEAALRGNLQIITLLIELGADPSIVDEEHDSTPLGWALDGQALVGFVFFIGEGPSTRLVRL